MAGRQPLTDLPDFPWLPRYTAPASDIFSTFHPLSTPSCPSASIEVPHCPPFHRNAHTPSPPRAHPSTDHPSK